MAGIIIEPVLGGGGCIPATAEYLKGIQEFAHKNKSLFILDEIVTGFRFRFGCLYPTMKLDPDIVTLGKIVGGGMPIGVMCGKKEIMKHADTTGKKKSERSYIGGGTFSANPMSMTSGFATLAELKKCDTKSLYKYHFKMIAQDGIFFLPGKLGAISNAHTKDDIKKMIIASENFQQ